MRKNWPELRGTRDLGTVVSGRKLVSSLQRGFSMRFRIFTNITKKEKKRGKNGIRLQRFIYLLHVDDTDTLADRRFKELRTAGFALAYLALSFVRNSSNDQLLLFFRSDKKQSRRAATRDLYSLFVEFIAKVCSCPRLWSVHRCF